MALSLDTLDANVIGLILRHLSYAELDPVRLVSSRMQKIAKSVLPPRKDLATHLLRLVSDDALVSSETEIVFSGVGAKTWHDAKLEPHLAAAFQYGGGEGFFAHVGVKRTMACSR